MDCTTYPLANALNYCSTDGYGPGLLHIGTIEGDTAPMVLLTNLASGRVQVAAAIADQLPEIVIEHPADLSPGHTYRVVVVAQSDVQGIRPLPFFPFVYDGEADDWDVATDAVQGVSVPFVKMFDGDAVHSHSEQWVSLSF